MDLTNINSLTDYADDSLSEILAEVDVGGGYSSQPQPPPAAAFSDEQFDSLMNQIGLAVQRQGGL